MSQQLVNLIQYEFAIIITSSVLKTLPVCLFPPRLFYVRENSLVILQTDSLHFPYGIQTFAAFYYCDNEQILQISEWQRLWRGTWLREAKQETLFPNLRR